jgi:membrane protease YdiL (CAAX protease family)
MNSEAMEMRTGQLSSAQRGWLVGIALVGVNLFFEFVLYSAGSASHSFKRFQYSELGTAILWLPLNLMMFGLILWAVGTVKFWRRPDLFPASLNVPNSVLNSIFLGIVSAGLWLFFIFLFSHARGLIPHLGPMTVVYILGPTFAELIFRGYLFAEFRQQYSFPGTTAAVTFLFFLCSFQLRAPVILFVGLIINSILASLLREKYGSVVPPILFSITTSLILGTATLKT